MISFEIPESIEQTVSMIESVATEMMRPQARYYDDHEHEIPWDYINFMHDALQSAGAEVNIAPASSQDDDQEAGGELSVGSPSIGYLGMAHYVEMLSWGDAVVKITQKAVELLGPMGYSREHLLEKWFRDAKINDLYEGTGQINRLIVARRILGYSRHELS